MEINAGRKYLLSVDIVGYSKGDDQRHRENQHALRALIRDAAQAAGLHRDKWSRQPAGDSEIAVVPPTECERRLVDDFPRHLNRGLSRHNIYLVQPARLRLRVAIHIGLVCRADNGYASQAVVAVRRLVGCAPLYKAIESASAANLALIVSAEIHSGAILQGYTTYRDGDFHRVQVKEKEYRTQAWIHVPMPLG
jgi:hypothetical protein